MAHLAQLLIFDPARKIDSARIEALDAAGYGCTIVADAPAAEEAARTARPDVLLIAEGDEPDADALALAASLKAALPLAGLPAVLLVEGPPPESRLRAALEAGIDDVVETGADLTELHARLPRLTRSSVMARELARRVATAEAFGLRVDPASFRRGYPEEPQILTVAQQGERLTELAHALNDEAVHCVPEISPFRAADRLDDGRFDAAVIAIGEADDLSKVQYLCGHIRNNPRLFNLPTLVLIDAGVAEAEKEAALYRGGAAIVMPGDTEPARLAVYLRMLVARQRWRWTLRDPFRATLSEGTVDRLGVVYGKDFWHAHATRCLAAAAERGSSLSVGCIPIPTLTRIREEYGAEHADILEHQLADWITGMTRIEDCVGRVEDDAFALLLPGTPEAEANRVVQRIVGILQSSEFHLGEEVMQAIHAWAEAGIATPLAGEDAAATLARARDSAL